MPKITVIDDSITIVKMLTDLLTQDGHQVCGMTGAEDALDKVVGFAPDLIILDVIMPDVNGYDLCRMLRNDTRTSHLPIMMLTSRGEVTDKVAGLEAGADDYIVKPFEPQEVLARIRTHLRRAKQHKSFSPLTGLPGNQIIEEEIKKCLSSSDLNVAILYLDLDNFKAYNDTYGFIKGDEMLRTVSDVLRESVQKTSPLHSFVGHIGGDDFIVVVPTEKTKETCSTIINEVDKKVPSFYNEQDKANGFVVTTDRLGQAARFPLVTLSIAAITNPDGNNVDYEQISLLSAALKKKAKELPGSAFVTG
ncbi:GGDEF domain-containing response regulator [Dethiobacter alkaliphilus]|uniref:GGDEF domain-containing response regulator n=1 Tax=Dethiobacter alkaliphilus TaxID=427926 RepID=UPI002226911E|nr:response regulator [Dethiobacter alkaliphilus]MCW3491044.1 response regulator [Dethiobacter alkaliphilus]